MGKERQRTRITSKVDQLPEDVRLQVDEMIIDTTVTYQEISEWLQEKGFEVSKSSIGRYALRTTAATQRLIEAQRQTEALVNVIKKNPDVDYTDAGLLMLMDGLVKKISTAEEEFDNLPLDKAGRLITSISRTKVYKDRVKQDMKKKVELAFEGMESEIMNMIKADAALAKELKTVLEKAKEKMMQDD
ncbi:phage protein Gp27 family protein [Clostridium amazonitimonense]|uniref:phage protein Gp27 family protein n=1 Tax=Clostridium amazonitimonense TaxID=1499689 RepID=UPI00050953B0|nr:phage protein Gp27 family protein [Clostridium amazonitimonense]